MRLSKKGWNNVLIFGVLLIIFVFNFRQQLNFSNSAPQRPVISPELTIVEIQTPDYVMTRTGREWKREPSINLSKENLQSIVNNWQTLPLTVLNLQSLPSSSFILSFFVIEQDQPIIVQLHQQPNGQYILQVNEDTFLALPVEQLTAFIGR